jgi:putative transposase
MKRKRHSREEVTTKLSKANELHERGKTQAEIARTLGVSAMTYHRWRKATTRPGLNGTRPERLPDLPQSAVEELREENGRLRQLVTDLSLEKLRLQEIVRALKNQ